MSSHQNMDEIIVSVAKCFPKRKKFQILESSMVEGQQNYLSEIIRLSVEFEEDGKQTRKFLILKVPKNTGFASACSNMNFFITEIFMYETVIPRINEYLDELLAPFHFRTTTDSKMLILENLTAEGYEQANNRQLYDYNQCHLVLKTLAHFHATTRKEVQINPDLLKNEVFQYPSLFDFKQKAAIFWEPIFCELLAVHNASFLVPKLKNTVLYLQQNYDEVKSNFHYSNFKFSVLNHGDFRKANILLKVGPNGATESVRIIDFQTCFWSSPVYDFMYFLILSANADVIDNHYESLLDWYLECLNEKLKQINCIGTYRQPDFTEDLRSLRICTIFHITVAASLLCTVDTDKLLQIITRGERESTDHYKEACLNDEFFTRTILSILKFYDKIGLFEP